MFSPLHRIGSGCGIEIRGEDLHVVVVKSRGAGVTVLGAATIEDFRQRPAADWGREYADFLTSCGLSHVSATVCLPRTDVIVRQVQLPAMKDRELDTAVRYQLDGMHPFADDEVCHAYAVVDAQAEGQRSVAVVIAEQATVNRYADLFEEAGIAAASFTVSASSMRAALQLRPDRLDAPLLVLNRDGDGLEVYGESGGRAALSVEFNLGAVSADRALQLAEADLRLERGETATLILSGDPLEVQTSEVFVAASPAEVFPVPLAAPSDFDLAADLQSLATAIESACPRLGWNANLLPSERRRGDSRLLWAPTAVLTGLLLVLGAGFLLRPVVQNRAYAASIEERLTALESAVAAAETDRQETADVKERITILEGLSGRTTQDLRILSEISSLLPEYAWLQSMTIGDGRIRLNGSASDAAPLLGILDGARTAEGFAFASSLVRRDDQESFEISASRGAPGAMPVEAPGIEPAAAEAEPNQPESDQTESDQTESDQPESDPAAGEEAEL